MWKQLYKGPGEMCYSQSIKAPQVGIKIGFAPGEAAVRELFNWVSQVLEFFKLATLATEFIVIQNSWA